MEPSGRDRVRRSSKRLSHRYLLPLIAALTLLAACNNNDVRDITDVRHPIISLAPEEMTISGSVRSIPVLSDLQERLAKAERTVTIGTLDGPPETIFGHVDGLAYATKDRIVIRDNMAAGKEVIVSMPYEGGRQVRFAKGYEHGSTLAKEALSEGPLACTPDNSVVMGFLRLPYLRKFDASSGVLKWKAAFPDYKPLTAWDRVRDGDHRFALSFGDPGDLVYVLTPVPSGDIVAQVFSIGAGRAQSGRATQAIERRSTYLISAATGQGTFISDSLPRVLAVSDRMLWAEDYPPQGHTIIVGFRY